MTSNNEQLLHEWFTRYILTFGEQQIDSFFFMTGEEEFISRAAIELGQSVAGLFRAFSRIRQEGRE